MPIDVKGKEILREPIYDKFRQVLIDEIMKTIDFEGKYGSELRDVIEKTLKQEKFKHLVNKLLHTLVKETDIDEKDCPKALSILMEEDIVDELKKDLHNQVEETYKPKRDKEKIYQEGVHEHLWKNIPTRYLGYKTSMMRDILNLIKENSAIKVTFALGFALLTISSMLFKSFYKAIVVGLTLSVTPGTSLIIMIANIAGALGGILIFFVSLSLVIQYIFLAKSRDERIRELAFRYLERRGEEANKEKVG